MSRLRQKLFKWKEKEKVPKTEWPELVGKVLFKISFFVIMGTEVIEKYAILNRGSQLKNTNTIRFYFTASKIVLILELNVAEDFVVVCYPFKLNYDSNFSRQFCWIY